MKNYKAFSLVELSLVVLVIGILIFGISRGLDLYGDSKLTIARNLTIGSIVNRVEKPLFWLETTLETSFDKTESKDGSSISIWRDNNRNSIHKNNATQSTATFKPTYKAKAINTLPAIQFDGNSDWMTLGVIGGMESNSKVTIFAVLNPSVASRFFLAKQDNQIDGKGYYLNTNNSFGLMGHQTTNYILAIAGQSLNKPYVLAVSYDGSFLNTSIDIYINGVKSTTVSRSGGPLALSPSPNGNEDFRIGAREDNSFGWFSGLVGEIIFFDSKLSDQNISEINRYLMKKWL